MNVKSSHTPNNCPCPSTSKDIPHYNWYKWAFLISKKHWQGRQAGPQSQESKTTAWSCRKCSFFIHWVPPRYYAGCPGYSCKQNTCNSCAQELLPTSRIPGARLHGRHSTRGKTKSNKNTHQTTIHQPCQEKHRLQTGFRFIGKVTVRKQITLKLNRFWPWHIGI